MGNPHDPVGAYHFCSGLREHGEPWYDPTQGNRATPFPFAGDPVSGTGWLLGDLSGGGEVMGGASTGPFQLAVGDTQEVVMALVAGQGYDRLGSVVAMKFNDRIAQSAFDMDFDLPVPPAPIVTAAEIDSRIMLSWDDGPVDFQKKGYAFEGFNVWQGESEQGPWTRIATYDIINGVTGIRDWEFVPSLGDVVEHTVQPGEDSGLAFHLEPEEDRIHEAPFINGHPYYFAVSSYAHNPQGFPRVLESAKRVITAIPQQPVMEVRFQAAIGDTIPVEHRGESDGTVTVLVTDPEQITGDDYQVSFDPVTAGPDSGKMGWTLTNLSRNEALLTDQVNQTGDDAYVSVEGIQVKVFSPDYGIRDIVQVNAAGEIVDDNLHHNLNSEDDRDAGLPSFYIHIQGESGDNWKSRLDWRGSMETEDYEFRFVDDPATEGQVSVDAWGDAAPYILNGYQNGPAGATVEDPSDYTPEFAETGGRLPFQAWMIDIEGNESQVFFGIIDDNGNGYWDANRDDGPWSPAGTNFERLYGTNQPYDEADILSDAGANAVDNLFWGEWWDAKHTFGRIIFSMYYDDYDASPSGNFFTEPPGPGTIVRVRTNKSNTEEDTFIFSTAGFEPERGADVARSRLDAIRAVPNPYPAYNTLETGANERRVTFHNLPEVCTIRVFSLSGQLVRLIEHQSASPFEVWNLENDHGLPVASGMYLIHIRTDYGDRIIKLGVVQRGDVY
jgi:hypothetical protein